MTKTGRLHEDCEIFVCHPNKVSLFYEKLAGSSGNIVGATMDFTTMPPSLISYFLHVSVTKVDGAVLELHKVKKSEAGSYLCIASNGHPPTVSRRVQLDIKCKFCIGFGIHIL